MIERVSDTRTVEALFADWEESMIWSCLQKVMGSIYTDDKGKPVSAVAVLADFCFFAGQPCRELVLYKPEHCQSDFAIMVPRSDEWAKLIEDCYGERAKQITRYAIKKEPHVFDGQKLLELTKRLAPAFTLQLIDEQIYDYCRANEWSIDLVYQYPDYESYRKSGLGMVVLQNGEPVSGASSYTSYKGGIEVEIDTREEYRRQGLASACGAGLILECLKRGIYPSWDAHNLGSVGLAEKLGYHFDHEYKAYEIIEY